jgi:hypothetical protein
VLFVSCSLVDAADTGDRVETRQRAILVPLFCKLSKIFLLCEIKRAEKKVVERQSDFGLMLASKRYD